MATTSYGKITIIDVTDVGNFSVYPYANGPNTQIYSEETNTYYPNWEAQSGGTYTSPLVLTPVVTYAGVDKTTEATVNWYLKTDLENPITTGFDPTYKTLTITSNIARANTYVVYVVKASYHTDTGADVYAEGEITFSLLTQPSSIKSVDITGTNVIKYASDSNLPTPSQVQLTANLKGGTNITGDGWKYWINNGWSQNYITNSGSGAVSGITVSQDGHTLTINASPNNDAAYFNADIAKFTYIAHATTGAQETYDDVYTIFQLRDGSSGSSLVTIDLTNDDQLVPLNQSGEAQWDVIGDLASTIIYVYRGSSNITSENPIKATLTNIDEVDLFTPNGTTPYPSTWQSGSNLPSGYYKLKVKSFTTGSTSGNVLFETTVYSYDKTDDTSVQSGTTYYSLNESTGIYSAIANPTGNPQQQGWYVRGQGRPFSTSFSLVGAPAGTDGQTPTIYSLEFPDGTPIYKNTPTGSAAGGDLTDHFAYSPDSLVLQGYEIQTNASGVSSKVPFAGRVLYKPNVVNNTVQTGNDEWGVVDLNASTGQYTFSNLTSTQKFPVSYSPYTFKLVRPTDTSTILDQETITIGSDGKVGNKGNEGKNAVNLLIDNENFTLNATEAGTTRQQTVYTGYQGYIGTTEDSHFRLITDADRQADQNLPATYTSSKTGLVSSVVDNNTHDTVTITLASGISVNKGETGTITLNFLYTDVTPKLVISKIISWDAKLDAKDGDNAITLTFKYGDGAGSVKQQFFKNEEGFAEIIPVLVQNGQDLLDGKTAGTHYTISWTNLINTSQPVPLKSDNKTAIIRATDISGVGSYSCNIQYPISTGPHYEAYISFTDYSDPLQVELISTVGDKLTNGVGEGIVYPQTTRENQVLDQVSLDSLVVKASNSQPSGASSGDYYFNTGDNKVYKYNGSNWVANTDYAQVFVLKNSGNPIELRTLNNSIYPAQSEFSDLSYVWSFRDKDGEVITPQSLTNLKVSYVDATHAPDWSNPTQVTGGQFIYINKNVINKKVMILCQVTKS